MEVHSKVVADVLGCSQVWVHKLRNSGGDLPPCEKRSARYFYPIGKLIAWAVERNTRPLLARIEALEERADGRCHAE